MAIVATKKVYFTGKFGEYFLMNIGLTVLSLITFGLGFFYQVYWNQKYFVDHLEIEV